MKNILLFFIFLVSINIGFSQIECIDIYDTEAIISILDTEQHIWCGTQESGLLKINKQTLEQEYFNTDNSPISHNRIKSILEYNEEIYFSSDSTIMKIVNGGIEEVYSQEGILLEDSNGNLLIGGRRDFYIMDPSGNELYHQNLMELVFDQCCSQITDIAIDANGNIWLSHFDFYEFDVLEFDGSTWTVYDAQNSILPVEAFQSNQIVAIDNHIYASACGFYQHLNGQWTVVSSIENFDYCVRPIEVDSENILWVGGNSSNSDPSSQIAYKNGDEWTIINGGGIDWGYINVFSESNTNSNIIYAGTDGHLLLIDKACLNIVANVNHNWISQNIDIFPVPSQHILNIETDLEIKKVSIFDAKGSLVAQIKNPGNQIDVSDIASGFYSINLQTNDSFTTKKIIIQ